MIASDAGAFLAGSHQVVAGSQPLPEAAPVPPALALPAPTLLAQALPAPPVLPQALPAPPDQAKALPAPPAVPAKFLVKASSKEHCFEDAVIPPPFRAFSFDSAWRVDVATPPPGQPSPPHSIPLGFSPGDTAQTLFPEHGSFPDEAS